MFDGFKIEKDRVDFKQLKQVSGLVFENSQITETGIQAPYFSDGGFSKFSYHCNFSSNYNLEIDQAVMSGEIVKEGLKMKGSFHKNHFGGHNYLDFSHSMFKTEVARIESKLGIPATELRLTNLEIGVNIDLGFNVKVFLDNHLLTYMGHPFIEWAPQGKSRKSIGYSCKRMDFEVKVYAKALQYDLPDNILRYEIKFLKMRELNKLGIFYLSDLLNQRLVLKCLRILELKWSKIKWSEKIVNPDISVADRVQLEIFDSRKIWRNFWNTDKAIYRKESRKFKRLKQLHCANQQAILLSLIAEKYTKLLDEEDGVIFTLS